MSQPVLIDPFTQLPLRYPERHPLAGSVLSPLGHRRSGDPIWPTLGAADDDDDAGDDLDAGDDQDDEPDGDADDDKDDDKDPEGADKLGDPGKKALASIKASRAKARADRDAARKERDEARAELAKAKAGKNGGKDDQPAAEEIRRQAREDAEKAARARSDERIVRAELKAAAAGKLEDPADAVAFLKASDFEVDEDGEVDEDELAAAIDDLLERKPHLAKRDAGDGKGGRRPKPDPSQGPRSKSDLDSRIAAARKAGDGKLLVRLENEKLRRPVKAGSGTPK